MVRVGVVSDSHGHTENLKRALRALTGYGITMLCHLGDDEDDIIGTEIPQGVEVHWVPGVFSPRYHDNGVPNRLIIEVKGWKVLLTHSLTRHERDLPDEPDPLALARHKGAKVVLYGHTHIPEVRIEEGFLFLNPGHLKDEDKKGYPPTFGLLDLDEEGVRGRIFELYAGGLLMEGRLGK